MAHPLLTLAKKENLHDDNLRRSLNAAKVTAASTKDKARKLSDGGGLYLYILPKGKDGKHRRLWRYKYRINGREGLYAIGALSEIGLADARRIHRAARWLVERGISPADYVREELARHEQERARRKVNTFTTLCEAWLARDAAKLAPLTMAQRRRELDKNVLLVLGSRQIDEIRKTELADLLLKVEARAPEVARNVRHHLAGIFEYAEEQGLIMASPVPGPKVLKPRRQQPHAALSKDRVGSFLRAVEGAKINPPTRIAVWLLLLTAVRKQELLAARWDEFDLDKAEWNIPAGRMKMRDAHWVPLSRQAIALLRELESLSHRDLLFPGTRNPRQPMSGNTINALFGRLGYLKEAKPHGLRALFSTYANAAGWNPDVIEKCLAHRPKDAIRAKYNRHDYRKEQREVLQRWADQVDQWHTGTTADVVPLRKRKQSAAAK